MRNTTARDCAGQSLCHRWRTCDRCAKIRAARFADRAEYLQSRLGQLAFARATPKDNTAQAIKKLRDRLIRAKLAPAGLWSVETGELYSGLHLNLIVPASSLASMRPRVEYAELITTSARNAAAYIVKRSGMPQPTQYTGNLIGEWGSVVQHLMADRGDTTRAVQAAAVNMSLMPEADRAQLAQFKIDTPALPRAGATAPAPRTALDYADIARRNLPALYAALASNRKV